MKMYEVTFAAEINVPEISEEKAIDVAKAILLANPQLVYVSYIRTDSFAKIYDPNERPAYASQEQAP